MNHFRLLHPSVIYRSILIAQRKTITTTYSRPCFTREHHKKQDKHAEWNGLGLLNNGGAIRPRAPRLGIYRLTNGKLQVEPVTVCQDLNHLVEQQQYQLRKHQTSRRSESLNKDVRITSLMCLTDGMHIYPGHLWKKQASDGRIEKDQGIKELPAVFMIEECQMNALLSVISSSILELQLKEKLLKLVNEVFHVDRLVCMIAKPHRKNADDITCNARTDHANSNTFQNCDHHFDYHNITQDRARISDIIRDEWCENDVKCCGYWHNRLDDSRLNSLPSMGHVYFHRGVPQLSSQNVGNVDNARNNNRPSKEQLHLMVQKLTEEMPSFFEKHHDFKIYSSDILFENKLLHLKTSGLVAYKGSIQSMKYSCFVYFADVQLEVLKITLQQDNDNIQVRWRVKGLPAHAYYINKLLRRKSKYRYLDAFSTFYIGQDGLIIRHLLDKVIPSPEEKVQSTSWIQRLALSLGLVRSPSLAGDWNSSSK